MHDHTGEGSPCAEAGADAGEPARRGRSRELSPTQRALGLLTRREHSHLELIRKLVAKGVASEEAEAVVAKLSDAGWQSDVRFAESRVRARVADGYGPRHIRAELATHRLDQETIHAALEAFGGDWADIARDLVRRRFGDALGAPRGDELTLRRKASDLLMRRGFDAGCIRAATRLVTEDFPED